METPHLDRVGHGFIALVAIGTIASLTPYLLDNWRELLKLSGLALGILVSSYLLGYGIEKFRGGGLIQNEV